MTSQRERCETFRAAHYSDDPLLMPNPWDIGTARLLEAVGFEALATTSAGLAHSLGRVDGSVSMTELFRHADDLTAAVGVPVSVDFENGFADEPDAVAANVRALGGTGIAGLSIEDYTGRPDEPIYDLSLAVERIEAAAGATQHGDAVLVLTARAENYLHGRADLTDTIARLHAYAEAGADCVYAPGLTELDDIRRVVDSVNAPVSVLALPGAPTVSELRRVGVSRVSVGSAFARVAMGAVARAGRELMLEGTYGYWDDVLGDDDLISSWG